MEAFDIKSEKQRIKDFYRQGKISTCLKVIEDEILVKARTSSNVFGLVEILILAARIEMELGMFPKAEAHLTEAGQEL